MPLAAHTYAFRSWPLPAALDEIRALGFTRVELWAGHVGADRNALRSIDPENGNAEVWGGS